jgi:starch synthase
LAEPSELSNHPVRVLFVAAEADPIIKVGGLGDVTGSLPRALQALNNGQSNGLPLDVRLALPFHHAIHGRIEKPAHVASFPVPYPGGSITAEVYGTHVDDLPVYLISGGPIDEDAPVYSLDTQKDGMKFAFFSLAVLELPKALGWTPDILHANDWHTALSVYLLHQRRAADPSLAHTRSILTVHNLPFMGGGTDQAIQAFGIPVLADSRLPDWGGNQPLPMGLATADFVTTVSPTYASEILTPEFGYGLERLLKLRSDTVTGILNGLDEALWDPKTDTSLAVNFTQKTIEKRAENKKALLQEMDLPVKMDEPLFIFIGRMDRQKGVDLAISALHQISDLPWQAVLLGTGDPGLEKAASQLAADFPDRVQAAIRFDAKLSRRMYAGGDLLLMPSRYEPCGLAQMIAMRYGCLPVARATGGLRDTVLDRKDPKKSTGFLFEDANPEAMAAALRRAHAAFCDAQSWQWRQKFAMKQNFSWQQSAEAYAHIYQHLLEA